MWMMIPVEPAGAQHRGDSPPDVASNMPPLVQPELDWLYEPSGPIVNTAIGLPEWTQADVDALRHAITDRMLHLKNLELALAGVPERVAEWPAYTNARTYLRGEDDLLIDRLETRSSLGNFLGQAITRNIDVSDIITFDHPLVNDEVNASLVQYLGYYEGIKARTQQQSGEPYQPTVHAPDVAVLIDEFAPALGMHGMKMDNAGIDQPATELLGEETGCYNTFEFGVGWTQLTGDTTIWDGSLGTYDNLSSDVPLNFFFYFFGCAHETALTAIRISTNGYATFHQVGGGATDGTDETNDTIPNGTAPNYFAAPWWDDLVVTDQGSTDRVSYKIEGAAGNAVMTIQWFSVTRVGGINTDFHRFQLKLFQASGQVQFHYDTTWIADTADNATTGLESEFGLFGICAFNCGNMNSAEPDRNFDFMVPVFSYNNCATPLCIEDQQIYRGNNFGATGTDISSCGSTDNFDMWYAYTPPSSGVVTVTTCGETELDTTLSVFASCGGAQLACNDQDVACPTLSQSTVTFNGTAGVTYLIRVAGALGKRGRWEIQARVGTGVLGDICSTCRTLGTEPSGLYFTTNNGGCIDRSSCALDDIIDEWFCWEAPATGFAEVSTCFPQTNFDTTLTVFDACPNGLGVEVACNDDDYYDQSACELNGLVRKAFVRWSVQAGVNYRIRVAGYNMAAGDYFIHARMACIGDLVDNDTLLPPPDGIVSGADLAYLLGEWGLNHGSLADIVGNDLTPPPDSFVNGSDLAVLLGAWGSCNN